VNPALIGLLISGGALALDVVKTVRKPKRRPKRKSAKRSRRRNR